MKDVYVVLSKTHTGIARFIRIFGKTQFNHASIALDSSLQPLYSFARAKQRGLLLGKLVRETPYRLSMGGKYPVVEVAVLKFEVEDADFEWIASTIRVIENDSRYRYNLYSVLTYPVMKGFPVDKTYSCMEFVVMLLAHAGYTMPKPGCRCLPDEMLEKYSSKLVFHGNFLDCISGDGTEDGTDRSFFAPLSWQEMLESATVPVRLLYRILRGNHA